MGYFVVFELNKYLVKKEMQALLLVTKEPLNLLKIVDPDHHPDFSRVEKKEIIYQGKLYDVLLEVKKGGETWFYCKHDVKEELLIAGFKRMVKSRFSQHLLDHVIKIAITKPSLGIPDVFVKKISYPRLLIHFLPFYLSPFSPPPEI